MTDSRQIKAKKNIITSFASQILVMLCGIIVPRVMIGAFGSEAYGATTSIAQFLAYITLLEGGIGGVARAALYKPLAQNDNARISAIMEEIKKFFRVIGWIFAAYVLVLAVSFKSISAISCMDWISTAVLVLVISISIFGQYFIGVSNSVLLQAAQKSYVTNFISIVATVLNAIFTVVLVSLGCNLIVVKLVSSIIFFWRPIALWLYVRKQYELHKHTLAERESYLTQKWSGLGQHIAFFLHSNTDVTVLTVLADLSTVAVYSVYNMIISHMQNLAISFSSGMEAIFGGMLAREEKKELHETFDIYESILSLVSILLFSVCAVLIIPFVRLYTAGITDANYEHPLFALLMILTAVSYCLRLPYHSMTIAAGHFKQTGVAAYGEAILNVVLSIILVARFGLIGVAIATLVATWFRFVYYVIYLSKHIFYRSVFRFVKRILVNAITFVVNCIVGLFIVSRINISNYLLWIILGIVLCFLMGSLTVAFNFVFFANSCKQAIKKFTKR